MPQLYGELRRVASGVMCGGSGPDHTLSPTAVVHEAVIRLLGEAALGRRRTAATCSRRQVLAMGFPSTTRGGPPTRGGRSRVDARCDYFEEPRGRIMVAVHEVLDRLAELDGAPGPGHEPAGTSAG